MAARIAVIRCWNIVSELKIDRVQPRIPPPLVMLLAAALMWGLAPVAAVSSLD